MQEAIQQNTATNNLGNNAQADHASDASDNDVNVGQTERWASALVGGGLALYGLTRRTWTDRKSVV